MGDFIYEPLDLKRSTFRLVRLLYGNDDTIQCSLFEAWFDQLEDIMDYAAVSYTWGSTENPNEITVDGSRMAVTEN